MIRIVSGVIVAAICASAIVAIVPPPAPASAAAQPAVREVAAAARVVAAVRGTETRAARCTQAWPYYEYSCLRDSRVQNGNPRVVRVIALSKPIDRAPPARR